MEVNNAPTPMMKGTNLTFEKAQDLLETKPVSLWSAEEAIHCVRHRECGTDIREVRWMWAVARGCLRNSMVIQAGVGAGSLSFVLMIACHQAGLTLWDIDSFCTDYRFPDMDPVITGDETNIYNPGFNELCGHDEYLEIIRAAGPEARGHVMTTIGEAKRTLNGPLCSVKKGEEMIGLAFLDAGKQQLEQYEEWAGIAQAVVRDGIVALHDCETRDAKDSIHEFLEMADRHPEVWGHWCELSLPHLEREDRGPWQRGWRTRAWRKML